MAKIITLGAHEYEVRPQKIGYLLNRLGSRLQEILAAEVDGVDGAALLGAKGYEMLKVFIPDLMPMHEFLGYASAEMLQSGEYSEATDVSPEPLQIKDAFSAAKAVNGGEVLDHLKALVGQEMLQKLVKLAVAKAAENSTISLTPAPSPTSQPTSGASDQTNSGTSAPTSE